MMIKRMQGRVLVTALVLTVVLAGWAPRAAAESGTKTDPTTGLSVTIPDSWVFTANTLDRIFDVQRSDNKDIEGVINYLPLDTPQTAREHAEELLGVEKQYGSDSHYSEVSDTTLAGLPAATFTEISPTRTLIETVAVKDGKVLELALWTPNDLLASVQGELDAIKNSLQFNGSNASAPAPAASAAQGTTKTDPTTGLSVTIPATWEFTANTRDRIFDVHRGDNKAIEGVINYLPLDAPQTAREHAEELLGVEKRYGPDSHYSEVSDTTLAGLSAATFTETGSTRTLIEIVAVKDGKVLELALWAPNDLLASVQGEFDSIKNSVRF